MKKKITEYLHQQNDHLNKLFSLNSNQTTSTNQIKDSLANKEKLLNSLENKLLTLENSFTALELKNLNEKLATFRNISADYQKELTAINAENTFKKEKLEVDYQKEITTINNSLKKLDNEKKNNAKKLTKELAAFSLNSKKENKLLEEKLYIEKQKYLSRTAKINEQLTTNLSKLEQEYNQKITKKQQLKTHITTETDHLIEEIETKYNQFLNSHKENILNIKQTFYNATNNVNNMITTINHTYKELNEKNEANFLSKIDLLDNDLKDFLETIQDDNRAVLDLFENQLTNIDFKIDKIKTSYQEQLNTLKNHYNKDITTINTLFQTERNNYQNQLTEATLNYEKQLKKPLKLSPAFKKSYFKYKKQIEKSLQILAKITTNKIKERQKRFYLEQLSLRKKFLHSQFLYRSLRFIKDEKKNASLKYSKRKKAIYQKNHQLLTELQTALNNNNKAIIEANRNIEISPLDSQVSLARQLHFNENSLLNLELDYEKETFLNKKSTLLYQSHLNLLSLKETTNYETISYYYHNNKFKTDNYLAIQFEKNVFLGKERETRIKKNINVEKSQLKSLEKQHQEQIFLLNHTSLVEKEQTKLKINDEKKYLLETLIAKQFYFNQEKLKLKKEKEKNNNSALETLKLSSLENNNYKNLLTIYTEILTAFQHERELLLTLLRAQSTKDDHSLLLSSLDFTSNYLNSQHQFSFLLLSDLFKQLKSRINENIEAHKLTEYDQKYKQIIDDCATEKQALKNEELKLNQEIKQLREEITFNYFNSDRIKEKITEIKATRSLILQQLKGLKSSYNAQAKKTAKNLKQQLLSLKLQHKNEKRFHQELLITNKNKQQEITKLASQLTKAHQKHFKLETRKALKIKLLEKAHEKETAHYQETITNLEIIINKFAGRGNYLFTNFNTFLSNYKTNPKENNNNAIERQIDYLFNTLNDNSLKTQETILLVIEQLYVYIRKEQFNLKQQFLRNYKLSLNELTKTTNKELNHLHNLLNDSNLYLESLFKISAKKLKRSLKETNQLQKHELKTSLKTLKELQDEEKQEQQQHKSLLTAFIANQIDVQKFNKKDYQNQLKIDKKALNEEIRATQKQIKENLIAADNKDNLYQKRLHYFNRIDKNQRRKLTSALKKRKKKEAKLILIKKSENKKRLKKLDRIAKKRDLQISLSKRFLINYQQRKIKAIKRRTKRRIKTATKELKETLKKEILE